VIADDSDLTLLGMQCSLELDHRCTVTAAARTLDELLSALLETKPDAVLVTDTLYGSDLLLSVQRIRETVPNTVILVVGSLMNGLVIHDLFASEVRAYLYRGDSLNEILAHAVVQAVAGKLYLSPTANAEFLVAMRSPWRDWKLDTEARTVLRLLALGLHISEIAAQLGVSLRRIYWVCQKLRKRFGVNTNEHLISMAVVEGFTRSD
jgi:DNA-binding NarL/FixJ family response regulator